MKDQNMNEGDMVWVYAYPGYEDWPEMFDEDEDGVYELELKFPPETDVLYYYSFGTNEVYDIEIVPAECSDDLGNRMYSVGSEDDILPAFIYATCDERPDGIEEIDNIFTVYPNPARDMINIEFEQNVQDLMINIVALTGHTVIEAKSDGQKMLSIPVNMLSEGLYFIQFKTPTRVYTKKLLIKH